MQCKYLKILNNVYSQDDIQKTNHFTYFRCTITISKTECNNQKEIQNEIHNVLNKFRDISFLKKRNENLSDIADVLESYDKYVEWKHIYIYIYTQ